MRAIVFEGTRSVGVRDVPDATLEAGSDALIRLTSSAICGTDLHMYDGRTGAVPVDFRHGDPVEQIRGRPSSARA